jgi:glycine C-acetyltransferase
LTRNPVEFLEEEYDELRKKDLNWEPFELMGASGAVSNINGIQKIILCSNNYLGLTTHPKLKAAFIEGVKKYGVGSGAVRPISGTMDVHVELEKRLAKFKNAEASLTYPTGYMVNEGLIPQLVNEEDVIISDELNHGSIIDGIRLSRAKRYIYKHTDMDDLSNILENVEKIVPSIRRILIITDGVFSMDGDIAPLDKIAKIAREYGSMVYVDDAHGEGVLGEKGKGIVSHYGLNHDDVHVEMGTFSKAYGTIGGHISGSEWLVKFAWNKSRTWLLSSSHPPAVVMATIAAIDVLENEPYHVKKLWESTNFFKTKIDELGFNTGNSQTPIIPIIVGEPSKAKRFADELFRSGIFVVPIIFPMVARELSRIRIQINAQLSKEQLEMVIENIKKIGKKLDVI